MGPSGSVPRHRVRNRFRTLATASAAGAAPIIPQARATSKAARTSAALPAAMRKKCTRSFPIRRFPSAMFKTTDEAARRSWSARLRSDFINSANTERSSDTNPSAAP